MMTRFSKHNTVSTDVTRLFSSVFLDPDLFLVVGWAANSTTDVCRKHN